MRNRVYVHYTASAFCGCSLLHVEGVLVFCGLQDAEDETLREEALAAILPVDSELVT